MGIKYLNHKQINFEKWDSAIDQSINTLIYAKSWYLNIISPGWDALVMGDYDIVMPLTYRRKYGIKYLFKPFFSQFLGVFYKNDEDSKYVPDFLNKASQHFRLVNIQINVSNSNFDADYIKRRQTQVLKLDGNYEFIKSKFNRSARTNVNKAEKENLTIEMVNETNEHISLVKEMYKDRNVQGVVSQDYIDLENIMKYAVANQIGEVYHVIAENNVCASAFFLKWKDRIISLQTANNNLGREKRALYKLLNYIINENAGKYKLLDFAGSNLNGVADWNLSFGAEHQYYYTVKINSLPKFIKWIKK